MNLSWLRNLFQFLRLTHEQEDPAIIKDVIEKGIVVRGTNLYPSALDAIMGRFEEVAEYRAEISERGGMVELALCIEPVSASGDQAALCARIEQAIRDAWSLRVPVRAVGPGELPRFELKARRWVRQPRAGTATD